VLPPQVSAVRGRAVGGVWYHRAMADNDMRYGAVLPGGTAEQQLEQAVLAERAGWDGVFVWEAAYGVDAWSLLSAMAVRTTRVRLGTMLTPLPWRRPWKVASEVATLDQLSGGRAVLAVGIGAVGTDLPETGEETDLRRRAEMLDEGIDLIRALWEGGTSFEGRRYRYRTGRLDLTAAARPVQERVPIWVVGVWPRPKSLRRALRCDGIIPQYQPDGGRDPGPGDARALRLWLGEHGARPGFDLVADGETPAEDPAAAAGLVTPWADAGCTWWLETRWEMPHDSSGRMSQIEERLAAGPPRPRPA
jgi:alkanesulfonate monooxygenase SsuD/methylene tetrahydromethanopterin reductase-like flavin-dependent oxidoreductase (luciferase family)